MECANDDKKKNVRALLLKTVTSMHLEQKCEPASDKGDTSDGLHSQRHEH